MKTAEKIHAAKTLGHSVFNLTQDEFESQTDLVWVHPGFEIATSIGRVRNSAKCGIWINTKIGKSAGANPKFWSNLREKKTYFIS